MPYVTAKNGYRMYVPQWQADRGSKFSSMKKLNAAAVNNNLGAAVFGTMADHGAGMAAIITQITVARIQAESRSKLDTVDKAISSLDTLV